MEDNKELEVVSGDGTNLDISPVYEHINQGGVPKSKKPTNIIMPKESKKLDQNEDEKDEDKDDDKNDDKKE